MSPEELDEARAKEADRLWGEAESRVGELSALQVAARLAREGWTPPEPEPEPVDPDVEAYWRWRKSVNPTGRLILNVADAFLAGARMATEQERERAKGLVDCVRNDAARLLELAAINNFDETVADGGITSGMVCRQEIEQIARSLSAVLAKYRGEA